MLALRLPPDLEKRLETLAKNTGRTKSYYAREAIVEHIEDLEDAYIALQRLEAGEGEHTISLEELEAKYSGGNDD